MSCSWRGTWPRAPDPQHLPALWWGDLSGGAELCSETERSLSFFQGSTPAGRLYPPQVLLSWPCASWAESIPCMCSDLGIHPPTLWLLSPRAGGNMVCGAEAQPAPPFLAAGRSRVPRLGRKPFLCYRVVRFLRGSRGVDFPGRLSPLGPQSWGLPSPGRGSRAPSVPIPISPSQACPSPSRRPHTSTASTVADGVNSKPCCPGVASHSRDGFRESRSPH